MTGRRTDMLHVKLITEENETIVLNFADLVDTTEFINSLGTALNLQDIEIDIEQECKTYPKPSDLAYLWN